MNKELIITECPRDAMQGLKDWIPTQHKVTYLNSLLSCGFDFLDFGSFVSPKAIPQLKDTSEVLMQLNESTTKLLAIIANERGAKDAAAFDRIAVLGYPFSISETFQRRNTNQTLDESLLQIEKVAEICVRNHKSLRVYLSMGFGNPYGDVWSVELLCMWIEKLNKRFPIFEFALSDTIATAQPEQCSDMFSKLYQEFPELRFAAHLHVIPGREAELIKACLDAGCTHFDTAIGGYGGCPMAKDDLTGNLSTESLVQMSATFQLKHKLNLEAFEIARNTSHLIFD